MREIPVYKGKGDDRKFVGFAMVDDEFYEGLSLYSWTLLGWGYPHSKLGLMHRVVWAMAGREFPQKPLTLDHIDLNKLNSQLSNLRVADKKLQAAHNPLRKDNTTGFKCVSRRMKNGVLYGWQVIIRINGKRRNCGDFASAQAAAREVNYQYSVHHPLAAVPNPTVAVPENYVPRRRFEVAT